MIKTVIVDDDIEMLQGLSDIICWEDYGFCIAGLAKNGQEGLDIISQTNPDVLITDITMPIINGLELIREAKKLNHNLKSIIISCHEDFNYAKEAIKLEADQYILKHTLTEEELIETIEKIKSKIETAKQQTLELAKAIKVINANKHILFEDFNEIESHIKDVTKSISSRPEVKKVAEYIETHLSEKISCDSMASYVNMNSNYFGRLFKSDMGVNFSDYIMNKRITVATELLKNSDCSIEEITEAIGIESVSYFYRSYKKLTGHTPGDIRSNRLRSTNGDF